MRNLSLALQPYTKHLSIYTVVAIAKSYTQIRAVLNEKQSFSHFVDFCSDKSTENEVEQEELKIWLYNPILNICFYTRQSQSQNVTFAMELSLMRNSFQSFFGLLQ
jgi:hypothetical protein